MHELPSSPLELAPFPGIFNFCHAFLNIPEFSFLLKHSISGNTGHALVRNIDFPLEARNPNLLNISRDDASCTCSIHGGFLLVNRTISTVVFLIYIIYLYDNVGWAY